MNDAEETLRQIQREQERLQNTLNAAGVGTWRWEFKTQRLVSDALMRQFFDIPEDSPDPGDPAPYIARTHPDDLAELQAALARSVETREKYAHIYRTVHSDGSIHWLDGRGHLEYDSDGNPSALIGTVIDITAQKETEEKYRTLINSMDQGYCLCEMVRDSEGNAVDYRLLEVNPGFSRISKLYDVVGKTILEVAPYMDRWWIERYDQIVRTGQPERFQHRAPSSGVLYDMFVSPLDANLFVVLFSDITEQVRREQEREELNERLRRSMQETHHRVKNNLQVISALVEMQTEDMDAETAAPLQRINQHVMSLAVIHDLLTQQAKTDGDTDHISTQSILDTLIPLLQNTVGNRTITSDCENIVLAVQRASSFALLVSECVSNAVKHGEGEIALSLRQEAEMARLEVCDSGKGFPSDFDPARDANTGLQLIESTASWDLRGSVQYDNHSEGGGRVTVIFPINAPS